MQLDPLIWAGLGAVIVEGCRRWLAPGAPRTRLVVYALLLAALGAAAWARHLLEATVERGAALAPAERQAQLREGLRSASLAQLVALASLAAAAIAVIVTWRRARDRSHPGAAAP